MQKDLHRRSDQSSLKFEGYMYPKPLCQDLTVFKKTTKSIVRQVPKDPACEIFPRLDPDRKTADGNFVLGTPTRRDIKQYVTGLYNTSTNSATFQDTSGFLFDKIERDIQFQTLPKDGIEAASCSRVHNHPDPCPYCWDGGYNISHAWPGYSESIQSLPKPHYDNISTYQADYKANCGQYKSEKCIGLGSRKLSETSQVDNHIFMYEHYEKPTWSPKRQKHGGQTSEARNEITLSDYHHTSTQPMWLLGRQIIEPSDEEELQYQAVELQKLGLIPSVSHPARNSWTFRDENNLRIPYLPDVVGNWHKTDAHRRYHMEHPEPVPDLRDFRRCAKKKSELSRF